MKRERGFETKEFHKWIKSTFNWVDNDCKRLMQRAWSARAKLERDLI